MYVRPTSTRLLRGMLIPAMRAMSLLALTLLVPRVLADHEDRAVAADDLAFLAHRLDRRSYLHDPFQALVSGDPALAAARAAATASWILPLRRPSGSHAGRAPDGSNFGCLAGGGLGALRRERALALGGRN